MGLAASAVNATVDAVTGRDMGEHAVAAYRGGQAKPADETETQEVAAAQAVPQQDIPPVLPVAEIPARADGMSHFAAFRPNAGPVEAPPAVRQTGDAVKPAAMMSPAQLAAKLNKQQAAERRAMIDRAEKSLKPQVGDSAADSGVLPPKNREKPSLSGNWFDSAMIDTLMKYQEMKQGR